MDFADEGEARCAHDTAVAITVVRGRLARAGTATCIDCDAVIPQGAPCRLPRCDTVRGLRRTTGTGA